MRRKGLTQVDVGEKIGHGQSWLSNKLTSKRGTKLEDISKIAKAIGESDSFILTGQRSKPGSTDDAGHHIPVIGWDDIADWPNNGEFAQISEWIAPSSPEDISHASFGLRVNDNSMSSTSGRLSILKGSKVIVSPAEDVEPGSIVLALVAGRPVIRTLDSDGIDRYLQPHNELYPPRPVDSDVRIVGQIVEIKLKLSDLQK